MTEETTHSKDGDYIKYKTVRLPVETYVVRFGFQIKDEEAAVTGEASPEQFLVWVCYITDNYGNPLVVKVVATDSQAMEWVNSKPRPVGVMEDETRGNRFVEYHTVEIER